MAKVKITLKLNDGKVKDVGVEIGDSWINAYAAEKLAQATLKRTLARLREGKKGERCFLCGGRIGDSGECEYCGTALKIV